MTRTVALLVALVAALAATGPGHPRWTRPAETPLEGPRLVSEQAECAAEPLPLASDGTAVDAKGQEELRLVAESLQKALARPDLTEREREEMREMLELIDDSRHAAGGGK